MKIGRYLLAIALLSVLAAPASAAGFGIFEQGSKAMGMAGAFTAQADDGSAMFHNVGGLAFQKEGGFDLGVTFITNTEAEFDGAAPFPGVGVHEEQKGTVFFPAHFYWVKPINEDLTFGFGFFTAFGLATEWEDPDNFTGRFISYKAELKSFDLVPSIGWQVTPKLGIGMGAIVRASEVELRQRAAIIDPFTFGVAEVADVVVSSDFDYGFGFNVGLLHKVNNSFSWGLSYRSAIEIDYGGDAGFTQISTGNPVLDFVVSQTLPFGGPVGVTTSIEAPDQASLGFAFALGPRSTLEVDVNWTGWSSFGVLILDFDDASGLDDTVAPQNYDDVFHYRLGYRRQSGSGNEWRFGYVYDPTPQPTETMSPLLPDADRHGFTIGWGHKGNRFDTDLAYMYLIFDERTTDDSVNGYFGTYNTTAMLLGATISF